MLIKNGERADIKMQSEMAAFFVYTDIYIKIYIHMVSDERIRQIISEEINKTDVEAIVSRKLSSSYEF
jgi:hypothetical protein